MFICDVCHVTWSLGVWFCGSQMVLLLYCAAQARRSLHNSLPKVYVVVRAVALARLFFGAVSSFRYIWLRLHLYFDGFMTLVFRLLCDRPPPESAQ